MVSAECENMRQVTWVCIKDVKQGEFRTGGQALTAADVRWLQRGDAVA